MNFLFKEAMHWLTIIPEDFPRVGAANVVSVNMNQYTMKNVENTSDVPEIGVCDYAKRTLPPKRPTASISMHALNNVKMKDCLLKT